MYTNYYIYTEDSGQMAGNKLKWKNDRSFCRGNFFLLTSVVTIHQYFADAIPNKLSINDTSDPFVY